jgi:hypothetical protein
MFALRVIFIPTARFIKKRPPAAIIALKKIYLIPVKTIWKGHKLAVIFVTKIFI